MLKNSLQTLFFKIHRQITPRKSLKMSTFVQKLNPITGVNDWVIQNEDYDFHQEVARSSFADMLHDTERNQLYELALKSAIDKTHAQGKKANVLDIGTGTGLLSMMAARHGADTITACEAFKPMSECALKIIARNGYRDKIKVLHKRSTELTVGLGGDLPNRCNILVTEVFDTELIGEGALSTFKHAHEQLLEKGSIVVPESATIYAQVIESPLLQNWNRLKDFYDDDGVPLIKIPDSVKNCAGSAAVHDIQMSQLPGDSFKTLVSPIKVLRFDFSGRTPFVFERTTINSVKSEENGLAQAVFMWWDLQMDTDGKIILSCAPKWAHSLNKNEPFGKIPWRDHWMQAVYYFPKELAVKKGEEINLLTCHDEYSLWFNVVKDLKLTDAHYLNPVCECGLHVAFSRTRIGQINDMKKNKKYLALLEKNITSNSTVLVLSDGFYFALVASKLGAKKVFITETNFLSRRVLCDFISFNKLNNVEVVPNLESLKNLDFKDVTIVLGEPYYVSSILPWDNLLFGYLLKGIRKFLTENVQVFPKKIIIKAIAVKFDDLYKIRLPLGSCEGFSMKEFDELIEKSSDISDDSVEAQPLWEYPGTALSEEVRIAELDVADMPEEPKECRGTIELKCDLECNGIALWVDWSLDGSPKSTINTGPISNVEIGKNIQWDMYTRQGVTLFAESRTKKIDYVFKFDFSEGNISFSCQ